jgi:flagellar export protein FliJ
VKRFAFRLERLLGLRAVAERERARAMGDRSRDATEAERLAVASAARERDAAHRAQQAGIRPTPAGAMTNLGTALDRIAEERVVRIAEQAAADAELELARLAYQAARADRRVLERLREIRHADWHTADGREDQKIMDEIALRPRQDMEGSTS